MLFQFLLGTLKTILFLLIKLLLLLFQFLLGTLKTVSDERFRDQWTWFQFLLGTLKTSALSIQTAGAKLVSIPLRYAKNRIDVLSPPGHIVVSIPLRYAKNLRPELQPGPETKVSIPLRYAKNGCTGCERYRKAEFQFLLGTLKTIVNTFGMQSNTGFNSS